MKNFNYSLSNDDCSAIVCAFDALPELLTELEVTEASAISNIATSTFQKLLKHLSLNQQDIILIATLVDFSYDALCGKVSINPDTFDALKGHMFTINKLHTIFSPLLN